MMSKQLLESSLVSMTKRTSVHYENVLHCVENGVCLRCQRSYFMLIDLQMKSSTKKLLFLQDIIRCISATSNRRQFAQLMQCAASNDRSRHVVLLVSDANCMGRRVFLSFVTACARKGGGG